MSETLVSLCLDNHYSTVSCPELDLFNLEQLAKMFVQDQMQPHQTPTTTGGGGSSSSNNSGAQSGNSSNCVVSGNGPAKKRGPSGTRVPYITNNATTSGGQQQPSRPGNQQQQQQSTPVKRGSTRTTSRSPTPGAGGGGRRGDTTPGSGPSSATKKEFTFTPAPSKQQQQGTEREVSKQTGEILDSINQFDLFPKPNQQQQRGTQPPGQRGGNTSGGGKRGSSSSGGGARKNQPAGPGTLLPPAPKEFPFKLYYVDAVNGNRKFLSKPGDVLTFQAHCLAYSKPLRLYVELETATGPLKHRAESPGSKPPPGSSSKKGAPPLGGSGSSRGGSSGGGLPSVPPPSFIPHQYTAHQHNAGLVGSGGDVDSSDSDMSPSKSQPRDRGVPPMEQERNSTPPPSNLMMGDDPMTQRLSPPPPALPPLQYNTSTTSPPPPLACGPPPVANRVMSVMEDSTSTTGSRAADGTPRSADEEPLPPSLPSEKPPLSGTGSPIPQPPHSNQMLACSTTPSGVPAGVNLVGQRGGSLMTTDMDSLATTDSTITNVTVKSATSVPAEGAGIQGASPTPELPLSVSSNLSRTQSALLILSEARPHGAAAVSFTGVGGVPMSSPSTTMNSHSLSAADGSAATSPVAAGGRSAMSFSKKGSFSTRRSAAIGPYRKEKLIGSGGDGKVFLATDIKSGNQFALKEMMISEDTAAKSKRGNQQQQQKAAEANKDFSERTIRQQVELLQSLPKHENVVTHTGVQRTTCALNIMMEYIPGGSISQLGTKLGAFNEGVVRQYTKDLAQGLAFLHARGIIHRDIKGANCLISQENVAKLADFGCCIMNDVKGITRGLDGLHGTSMWMSPECITQQATLDCKTDIWSLACTVVEMATGKAPWYEARFTNEWAAMFYISQSGRGPPIPPHLSRQAHRFLAKCFSVNPADRPSAEECLADPFLTSEFVSGGVGPDGAVEREMCPPSPSELGPAHNFPNAPASSARESSPGGESDTYATSCYSSVSFAVYDADWGNIETVQNDASSNSFNDPTSAGVVRLGSAEEEEQDPQELPTVDDSDITDAGGGPLLPSINKANRTNQPLHAGKASLTGAPSIVRVEHPVQEEHATRVPNPKPPASVALSQLTPQQQAAGQLTAMVTGGGAIRDNSSPTPHDPQHHQQHHHQRTHGKKQPVRASASPPHEEVGKEDIAGFLSLDKVSSAMGASMSRAGFVAQKTTRPAIEDAQGLGALSEDEYGFGLPEPILYNVFHFLGAHGLCQLSSVTKGVQLMVEHGAKEVLWRKLFLSVFGDDFDAVRLSLRKKWKVYYRDSARVHGVVVMGRYIISRRLCESTNVFEGQDMETEDRVVIKFEPIPIQSQIPLASRAGARLGGTMSSTAGASVTGGFASPMRTVGSQGSNFNTTLGSTASSPSTIGAAGLDSQLVTPTKTGGGAGRLTGSASAPSFVGGGPSPSFTTPSSIASSAMSPPGPMGRVPPLDNVPPTPLIATAIPKGQGNGPGLNSPCKDQQATPTSTGTATLLTPGSTTTGPPTPGSTTSTTTPGSAAAVSSGGSGPSPMFPAMSSTPLRGRVLPRTRQHQRPLVPSSPLTKRSTSQPGVVRASGGSAPPAVHGTSLPPPTPGSAGTASTILCVAGGAAGGGSQDPNRPPTSAVKNTQNWSDLYDYQRVETSHHVAPKPFRSQVLHGYKMNRHLEAMGVSCVPRVLCYAGNSEMASSITPSEVLEGCNVLVTSNLGPSLNELLRFCGNQFSIPTAMQLALRLLRSLQGVHDQGVVHGGISPSNILMGSGEMNQGTETYLVNFNHSRYFKDPKTGRPTTTTTGAVRPKNQELLSFCSTFVQKGCTPAPRDDVIALGYVLCYLVRGGLPWIVGGQGGGEGTENDLPPPTAQGARPQQGRGGRNPEFGVTGRRVTATGVGQPGTGRLNPEQVIHAKNHFLPTIEKQPPVQLYHFLSTAYKMKQGEMPDTPYLMNLIQRMMADRGWQSDGHYDWSSRIVL